MHGPCGSPSLMGIGLFRRRVVPEFLKSREPLTSCNTSVSWRYPARTRTKGLNPMRSLIALVVVALVCGIAAPAPATQDKKKKIVFVAGGPSHGYGDHEHLGGCMLLAKCLNESGLPVEAVVTKDNGWPKDPAVFDGVSAIVMYSDGGGGHMANKHLAQVDPLAKKG